MAAPATPAAKFTNKPIAFPPVEQPALCDMWSLRMQ
jgi:hypothetical protein